jgi:plastocyanin
MRWFLALLLAATCFCSCAAAQNVDVRGRIEFNKAGRQGIEKSSATKRQAVVWLAPLDRPSRTLPPKTAQLIQKDKAFHPHVIVIPAGSEVEFPNHDPFFHNVFSLFEGKRFDLGMYEAGSTRKVRFEKPGISYIFCNIHPQMSAVVIALGTSYFAWADAAGNYAIEDVPPGRYELSVWADGASPETLETLKQSIAVSSQTASIAAIQVPVASAISHKNKYGRDYEPTAKAPYEHP